MKITRTEDLPDVLTAKHIADHSGISRSTVYALFKILPEHGGIPNRDIGTSVRVDKQDYLEWLDSTKKQKEQRLRDVLAS